MAKRKKEENVKENKGRIYSILGLISSIISLALFPIFFGPAAIILGIIARKKGDSVFGLVVIILGAVFMVMGMVIGALVYLIVNADKLPVI